MTKPTGRPQIPPHMLRETYTVRLPQWLKRWIQARPETGAALIESALVKAHKLKPPKGK